MLKRSDLVGGRYRIIAELGHGGMATVYRAHDERLGRHVALKVTRPELGNSPTFAARLEREARRAAAINHPNVVAVYDYGVDGGRPFIVLELVEGSDLARLIRRGRMPPDQAVAIARDVCHALTAAHRRGIVHRDVKPANVLLSRDGVVKVGDFGIAHVTGEDSLTGTGEALGSVDYFSPEQARGEPATKRSDIYALGIVLWEMLAGQRPFHGETPWEIATARLAGGPPNLRRVAPDVPAALEQVVGTALQPDPTRRYRTAASMERALAAWATPIHPTERMAPVGVPAAPTIVDAPAGPSAPERDETGERTRRHRPAPPPAAPRVAVSDRGRRRKRSPLLPLLGAAFVAAMLVVGYVAALGRAAPELAGSGSPTPSIVAAFDQGQLTTSSPAPTEPPPSRSPTPKPRRSSEPTATPAPVAEATPLPTLAPTPAAAQEVATAEPLDTVLAFYDHVSHQRFDRAYALWDARMKSQYPRRENLDERFDNTRSIVVNAVQQTSGTGTYARVAIDFTEHYDGGSSRRFVGSWDVVRVQGSWLLDQPYF